MQNSVVQKRVVYNYVISKYLQKTNDKKNKLMILRKYVIGKYKAFKE